MPKLILLLAIGLALLIGVQRIRALPPAQRKRQYLTLVFAGALIAALALVATGRMHWLGAALTGLLVMARQLLPVLLPLLLRLIPALRTGRAQPSAGRQSTVETAVLRMVLDHDSGKLGGTVLEGEFNGQSLDQLDRTQLQTLLQYCLGRDRDSVQLLQSYLQNRFGSDGEFSADSRSSPPSDGNISRAEAFAILGLSDGADRKAIIDAHRRLMQKLHPDRGGNDYLAAKVNQAKDMLLD